LWIVFVNPLGPHHLAIRFGSLMAAKIWPGLAGTNLLLMSDRLSMGLIGSPIREKLDCDA